MKVRVLPINIGAPGIGLKHCNRNELELYRKVETLQTTRSNRILQKMQWDRRKLNLTQSSTMTNRHLLCTVKMTNTTAATNNNISINSVNSSRMIEQKTQEGGSSSHMMNDGGRNSGCAVERKKKNVSCSRSHSFCNYLLSSLFYANANFRRKQQT